MAKNLKETYYSAANDEVFVCKSDVEAWLELYKGQKSNFVDFSGEAKVFVYFQVGEIQVRINGTLVDNRSDGTSFFGRPDSWTHLRVRGYWGSSCNLMGKGKHSNLEARSQIFEAYSLLTGRNCK